jgi:hypothetical protein
MARDQLLTVRQLAEEIRPGANEGSIAYVSRRIRHWSVADALKSVSDGPSGLGRHRRFDREAIYIGIVLDALTDIGVSIEQLKLIGSGLHEWYAAKSSPNRKSLDAAISGASQVYLRIEIRRLNPASDDGGYVVMQMDDPSKIVRRGGKLGVNSAIVLDLTALLARPDTAASRT